MTTLTVMELGRPLEFSFEDLLLYHGPGSPGGVAHAFKVLECSLGMLSEGEPWPERRELVIETAFPGPGARDAFEMLSRCVSDGRYRVDLEHPDAAHAIASARGFYFFRVSHRNRRVDCRVRPGMVRDEFIQLSRQPHRDTGQETRLTELKWEMTERLMALPAEEVYEASLCEIS